LEGFRVAGEGRAGQNGPRADADISLNPHDPLLMQYRVSLTNDLMHSVPGAFCLV
jgi:hypothetical protein